MKRLFTSLAAGLLVILLSMGGLRPESAFAASAKSVSLTTADGLDVASNLGVTGANITMEAWVNVRTAPTSGQFKEIVSLSRGGTSPYKVWQIAYQNAGGTLKLTFQQGRICVGNDYINVNYDLGTNTWRHVALTDNGTTVRGYVDGAEIVNGASGGAGSSCTADHFNVNDVWYEDNAAHRLEAYYDEVRVWDVVRTPTQISDNYCTSISSTTNLRASYQFESSTTADVSGNAYDLTVFHGTASLLSSSPSCLASATPKTRPVIFVNIFDGYLKPEDSVSV